MITLKSFLKMFCLNKEISTLIIDSIKKLVSNIDNCFLLYIQIPPKELISIIIETNLFDIPIKLIGIAQISFNKFDIFEIDKKYLIDHINTIIFSYRKKDKKYFTINIPNIYHLYHQEPLFADQLQDENIFDYSAMRKYLNENLEK